jgi:hypothetical protein
VPLRLLIADLFGLSVLQSSVVICFKMENLVSELNSDQVLMHEFDLQDALVRSTPDILKLAREYYQLRVLPDLSDPQADRLGEILNQAIADRLLDFWITEVEHSLGHNLALLTSDRRHDYEDQRARLREYLIQDEIPALSAPKPC